MGKRNSGAYGEPLEMIAEDIWEIVDRADSLSARFPNSINRLSLPMRREDERLLSEICGAARRAGIALARVMVMIEKLEAENGQ